MRGGGGRERGKGGEKVNKRKGMKEGGEKRREEKVGGVRREGKEGRGGRVES